MPAHHLPVLREVAECHQEARATSQWDIGESLMVPSDWLEQARLHVFHMYSVVAPACRLKDESYKALQRSHYK